MPDVTIGGAIPAGLDQPAWNGLERLKIRAHFLPRKGANDQAEDFVVPNEEPHMKRAGLAMQSYRCNGTSAQRWWIAPSP
jgi:hypothetical protein